MSSDVAMQFYELCAELKLTTEEERKQLLIVMAKEGLIDSVVETGRNKEQIIKDYTKHYKVISDIGFKGEDHDEV